MIWFLKMLTEQEEILNDGSSNIDSKLPIWVSRGYMLLYLINILGYIVAPSKFLDFIFPAWPWFGERGVEFFVCATIFSVAQTIFLITLFETSHTREKRSYIATQIFIWITWTFFYTAHTCDNTTTLGVGLTQIIFSCLAVSFGIAAFRRTRKRNYEPSQEANRRPISCLIILSSTIVPATGFMILIAPNFAGSILIKNWNPNVVLYESVLYFTQKLSILSISNSILMLLAFRLSSRKSRLWYIVYQILFWFSWSGFMLFWLIDGTASIVTGSIMLVTISISIIVAFYALYQELR